MSISLLLPNILNAIAATSVSGVTFKDIDEVAESWTGMPYVFYPNVNPPGFITGWGLEYVTVLRGTDAPVNISYTLNYRLLALQSGAPFAIGIANTATKFNELANALLAVASPYSGRVVMQLADVSIGPKTDPAGNQYHGADFALAITEQQN